MSNAAEKTLIFFRTVKGEVLSYAAPPPPIQQGGRNALSVLDQADTTGQKCPFPFHLPSPTSSFFPVFPLPCSSITPPFSSSPQFLFLPCLYTSLLPPILDLILCSLSISFFSCNSAFFLFPLTFYFLSSAILPKLICSTYSFLNYSTSSFSSSPILPSPWSLTTIL